MVGILIRNRIGMEIYGTNTGIEQVDLGTFEAGEELDIDFRSSNAGSRRNSTRSPVATQYADGSSHDWLDDVITLKCFHAAERLGLPISAPESIGGR